MKCTTYPLQPTSLEEVIAAIKTALQTNYADATVEVAECPDLRRPPFNLAAEGLGGTPVVADIGGQQNIFPRPLLDMKYSMINIAKEYMQMAPEQGMLIGAGAGPFHVVGQNSELAPNLAWKDGFDNVANLTYFSKIDKSSGQDVVVCQKCPSTDCALMMNLFGSSGLPGQVVKITARKRNGSTKSFTDVVRLALHEHFGDARPVSLGGVFVIRKGKATFHVMPDFPPDNELPFDSREQLNDWLTYHDFPVKGNGKGDEIVCLSVLHSADPDNTMGLRIEHTHCFSLDGRGGHYHYDLEDEEIEYEGYFNVVETIYRVDRPEISA